MIVGLLTPVYAFGTYIWLAVGCTFIISVILLPLKLYFYDHNGIMLEIHDVKKQIGIFQHFIKSIILIYKIFLSQSITDSEMPKQPNAKFLVILLNVLSLVLASLYSSSYTSIMTIPLYEKAIDTVQDLANRHIHWGASDHGWIEPLEEYEETEYRKLVELFIVTNEDQLRIYAETKKFGFAIQRFSPKSYGFGDIMAKDTINYYHVMKSDIYWSYLSMIVRKSSVLLPELDRFILNAHAGGLLTKLHEMASRVIQQPQSDHNVVKLNWSHVIGPFTILLFGYIISSISFIIELVSHKMSRRNVETEC